MIKIELWTFNNNVWAKYTGTRLRIVSERLQVNVKDEVFDTTSDNIYLIGVTAANRNSVDNYRVSAIESSWKIDVRVVCGNEVL